MTTLFKIFLILLLQQWQAMSVDAHNSNVSGYTVSVPVDNMVLQITGKTVVMQHVINLCMAKNVCFETSYMSLPEGTSRIWIDFRNHRPEECFVVIQQLKMFKEQVYIKWVESNLNS